MNSNMYNSSLTDRGKYAMGNIRSYLYKKQIYKQKELFLILLVPVMFLIVFHYVPIYGILIAFKDYSYRFGIIGSPWNNFAHFKSLFNDPFFYRIFWNTVILNIYNLVFAFPAPIILALLLNEVKNQRFKKISQSISYLPNFMAWTVLAVIITELVSPQRGVTAFFADLLNIKTNFNVLTNPGTFRGFLVITGIWKDVGWGSVIYLAALSGVNISMYEAAEVDGASRFQKVIHISIPSIMPIIVILFILRIGSIMNAGFDQIFNLYNPLVYEVADVIDTYVYRSGILEGKYDVSTAVGLFKNVVGVLLMIITNFFVRRVNEYGLW